MTLVELLVAMSVLAIATTLITMLVVSLTSTFHRQEAQHDSTGQAALSMQQLSRIIRAAVSVPDSDGERLLPPIRDASSTSLTLTTLQDDATADPSPTRVELTYDASNGELVVTRYAATADGGGWIFEAAPEMRRVVARDVASAELFTYLNGNGDELPIGPSGRLTADQMSAVTAVRVQLIVQTDASGRATPVQIQNTVGMLNLGPVRDEGNS